MRIDIKKLVADIKEVEGYQRECKQEKDENGHDNRSQSNTDKLTSLYSFRAHLRGRLHMRTREMCLWQIPKGTKVLEARAHAVLVEWTMELQEKLVAPLWEQYRLYTDEEEKFQQILSL